MNKIKPILFNTAMVEAILDGRKTQTRRIMKPANPFYGGDKVTQGQGLWVDGYTKNDEPNGHIKDYSISSCWWRKEDYIKRYAPYKPGDILWVRETWAKNSDVHEILSGFMYKADGGKGFLKFKWRPSIHMPREAARIFLKVKGVRVERVQEITPKDAWEEGCRIGNSFPWEKHIPKLQQQCRDILFKSLWDSIYAAPKAVVNDEKEILYYESYPWEDIQETKEYKGKPWYVHGNPWVWVYEFEKTNKEEAERLEGLK
jgi:hypothetical protein